MSYTHELRKLLKKKLDFKIVQEIKVRKIRNQTWRNVKITLKNKSIIRTPVNCYYFERNGVTKELGERLMEKINHLISEGVK